MKHRYWLTILILALSLPSFAITPQALADSMTHALGFPSCVAPVVVKSIRVQNRVGRIRCNRMPSCRAFTASELADFKRRVAGWVDARSVLIYSEGVELDELVVRHQPSKGLKSAGQSATVALWAGHGRFHRVDSLIGEDRWIWQRAKQWMTVEDRLTVEYSTRVSDLLRNAGIEVVTPRPDPRSEEGRQVGESGYPRWMEGAIYSLRRHQYPDTVCYYTRRMPRSGEYLDDLYGRPQWVNHLVEQEHRPIDLVLAIHTDGIDEPGDSAMVGTLALYTDHRNRQYAHLVQHQLVEDMRRTLAPRWAERELRNCQYVESRIPVVPALLLEIASHKDISDARYLLDPTAMDIAARAIYKGIARTLYGYDTPIAPLRPDSVRITPEGVLSWVATIDSLEPSAMPESYLITDESGKTWTTTSTSILMTLTPGHEHRYTIRAVNAGGCSRPTVPVAICSGGSQWVQILNTFTRVSGPTFAFDTLTAGIVPGEWGVPDSVSYAMVGRQTEYRRTQPWVSDDDNGWGECTTEYADILVVGNTHDYHLAHAAIWRNRGYSYIATYGVEADPSIERVDSIAEHHGPVVLAPGEQVRTPWGQYPIYTDPNAVTLYCNRAERIALRPGDRVLGRFRNGLPAIILRGGHLLLAFRLEAAENWTELYQHLLYEEEKSASAHAY